MRVLVDIDSLNFPFPFSVDILFPALNFLFCVSSKECVHFLFSLFVGFVCVVFFFFGPFSFTRDEGKVKKTITTQSWKSSLLHTLLNFRNIA